VFIVGNISRLSDCPHNLCCVSDVKDMGWIRVAEVRVVVCFCEHGNEHEICVSFPDVAFCSGRGTDEVSGRQC
jgi:hypothetical protein